MRRWLLVALLDTCVCSEDFSCGIGMVHGLIFATRDVAALDGVILVVSWVLTTHVVVVGEIEVQKQSRSQIYDDVDSSNCRVVL